MSSLESELQKAKRYRAECRDTLAASTERFEQHLGGLDCFDVPDLREVNAEDVEVDLAGERLGRKADMSDQTKIQPEYRGPYGDTSVPEPEAFVGTVGVPEAAASAELVDPLNPPLNAAAALFNGPGATPEFTFVAVNTLVHTRPFSSPLGDIQPPLSPDR